MCSRSIITCLLSLTAARMGTKGLWIIYGIDLLSKFTFVSFLNTSWFWIWGSAAENHITCIACWLTRGNINNWPVRNARNASEFQRFLPLHSWLSTLGQWTDSSKHCAGYTRSKWACSSLKPNLNRTREWAGWTRRHPVVCFPTNTKEVRWDMAFPSAVPSLFA